MYRLPYKLEASNSLGGTLKTAFSSNKSNIKITIIYCKRVGKVYY